MTAEERIQVCDNCPELKGSLPWARCGVCGCFVEAKARIPISECPLGKWNAEPAEEQRPAD